MNIAMDRLSRAFSRGLDIIEEEQLGASDQHRARVAALCATMGRCLGYDDDAISALSTCALFHDNALTEYNLSEKDERKREENLIKHCVQGQGNVAWLPFKTNIDGIIYYHHERGDGLGPFHKKEGEYPYDAALLAAADATDITFRFQETKPVNLEKLRDTIWKDAETYSTKKAISLLLDALTPELLDSLRNENISSALDRLMPAWTVEINDRSVTHIASFFSHVVDFKSRFTRKHSSQIANRTYLMAKFYGKPPAELSALYLAASLHDIGKLATPTAVLEKPGKLTPDEFQIIKDHVRHTHEWLSEIPDFELIRDWAAAHHEKLDGGGYTFGKATDELDFGSRLIACIDIYQAVSEARPYHDARSHEDTMPILYSMANKGFIDMEIVKNLDEVMAEYSLRDVPPP